jgi:DNA-binding protein YbaB
MAGREVGESESNGPIYLIFRFFRLSETLIIYFHYKYMGIIDKLKDINEMRKQAKAMEGLLAVETVSGHSSGNKIVLTMDGNQNIKSVEVSPDIVGDKSEIARNIRSALEDLFKQHKKMLQSKFGHMMQ